MYCLINMILGPLPNTLVDFWRMVWQEKVRTIAMVTNVIEGKTKKCEQYWPEGAGVSSFGPFDVSVVEQQIFADYIIRHIRLIVSLLIILGTTVMSTLYY